MSNKQAIDVRNNERAHRFEATIEGHLAIAEYQLTEDGIVFTHTEVPAALEGKGVGSALVKAGLGHAREHGLKVTPRCSFFAAYMKKHTEAQDLLAPSARPQLGL